MNIIIHIGTTKTATTTIQEFMKINSKYLEVYGYHFYRFLGSLLLNYAINEEMFNNRKKKSFYLKKI